MEDTEIKQVTIYTKDESGVITRNIYTPKTAIDKNMKIFYTILHLSSFLIMALGIVLGLFVHVSLWCVVALSFGILVMAIGAIVGEKKGAWGKLIKQSQSKQNELYRIEYQKWLESLADKNISLCTLLDIYFFKNHSKGGGL